jgi:hypothetical protein
MVLLFLWFSCFNEIAYSSKKKNTKSMITKSKRHGTLYQIKDGFSISHLKRPKYKREVKPIFDRVKPKIENQEGPLALLPSH